MHGADKVDFRPVRATLPGVNWAAGLALLALLSCDSRARNSKTEREPLAPGPSAPPTASPAGSSPAGAASAAAVPVVGTSTSVVLAVSSAGLFVASSRTIGELEVFDLKSFARRSLGRYRKVDDIVPFGNFVYFTRDETHVEVQRRDLMRVPVNGGPAQKIPLESGNPGALVGGDGRLWLLAHRKKGVSRLVTLTPTGKETPMVNLPGRFVGARFERGALFWSDPPELFRLSSGARKKTTVARASQEWMEFTVVDNTVFWLDQRETGGRLLRVPSSGGPSREVAGGLTNTEAPCSDGKQVAFTRTTGTDYQRSLLRVAASGGTPVLLLAKMPWGNRYVCDGLVYYWVVGDRVLTVDAGAKQPKVSQLGRRTTR